MKHVQALLESSEELFESEVGQVALYEANQAIMDFPKVLKAFVMANPQEFIVESIEETFKNIRVFSEVATQQFITEVTSMKAADLANIQIQNESNLSDYL